MPLIHHCHLPEGYHHTMRLRVKSPFEELLSRFCACPLFSFVYNLSPSVDRLPLSLSNQSPSSSTVYLTSRILGHTYSLSVSNRTSKPFSTPSEKGWKRVEPIDNRQLLRVCELQTNRCALRVLMKTRLMRIHQPAPGIVTGNREFYDKVNPYNLKFYED
jgi:hypothetical protein